MYDGFLIPKEDSDVSAYSKSSKSPDRNAENNHISSTKDPSKDSEYLEPSNATLLK